MRTVLILMDTLNRRYLKTYDKNARGITPNIDKFAEESVIFENHFIGSAPCMPARRDIFTGRMQFLERGWGGIEPFDITLPEMLRKHKIFTHITTDHTHYFELVEKIIASFLIHGIIIEDRNSTHGCQKSENLR